MNYDNVKARTDIAMDATAVLALAALLAPGTPWLASLAIPVWLFCLARFVTLAILAPSTWEMLKTSKLEMLLLVVPFLRVFRLARLARVAARPVRLVKAGRATKRLTRS